MLTYYGIASLGRALLLLMKSKGGEDRIKAGHGLKTSGWRNVMNRKGADDLMKLQDLMIVTQPGLFSDFLANVKNATLIYHRSGGTIGPCECNEPDIGIEISLGDLLARVPDLRWDHASVAAPQYASVTEFSNDAKKGLKLKLVGDGASCVARAYGELGYTAMKSGEGHLITCDSFSLKRNRQCLCIPTYRRWLGPFHIFIWQRPFGQEFVSLNWESLS